MLRKEMTDAEQLLWHHLRHKQIANTQFYRQKPLLHFIVDFYSAAAKLVIEVDGSQHYEEEHRIKDQVRDATLANLGIVVLRFSNQQVLVETDSVLSVIYNAVTERVEK